MAKTVRIYRRKYSDKTHWCIRYDFNGKDKKEVIGTSKREAQIAAQKKAIELYGDKASLVQKDIKIGMEDLYDEYMKRKRNLADGSRKRYKNNFDAFIDFMKPNFPSGSGDIRKIKRQHIEEFLDYMLNVKNRAPKTINGALGFINALFIYAKKEDYILKSPTRDIEKFALNDEKEAPYFTRKELVKIWDNVNPYWLSFLQFLYYTGMRKGELINLTWKNVNLKKGEEAITVISSNEYRTKTGKKRTIPLKSEAIAILNKQKGEDKKYVFISREGKKIHPEKPYHAIKKALEKVGLEGDVHKLRHTFASHCVIKGVSIYEVKELLGHQDIKTTMIYAHLSPNTLRKAVNKLESFAV
ncbi:MAG: site-specific integrase [Candidatus Marinimicrobia bacterium]|nr:site-specific integrase [Candidatus Neomarinimicrobiota bacterium]